ncbi:MAG: 2-dehydropantoate 2-reductase [Burkholderiaceae bacterium]
MSSRKFSQVTVVGAGAVGCFYGGLLAQAGTSVTLIGRPAHVDAINTNGLRFDSKKFNAESIKVAATTQVDGVAGANLVLFCVKTGDTEATAAQIKPHLAPDAVILLVQNGVDNLRRLKSVLDNPVVPSVVYVAASMAGPGHLLHAGAGSLIIGKPIESADDSRLTPALMQDLSTLFEAAQIPCPVSDDVDVKLWSKLAINCAFNAISAVGQANYATILDMPAALESMKLSINEVAAVANAAGIGLDADETFATILKAGNSMRPATSSTAQDLVRGKLTEIDELNGYVARRGKELGVPTPVNHVLHALVKLRETGLSNE